MALVGVMTDRPVLTLRTIAVGCREGHERDANMSRSVRTCNSPIFLIGLNHFEI
jgi:hypothetical protein